MDGWMDGWTDGRMDGWMNDGCWMDKRMIERVNEVKEAGRTDDRLND